MKKHYDWLIVGAGFTGAVLAERLASRADKRVLLIDRRKHLGGNAYDCLNEHGHLFHQYGPHIFHTNSQQVVDYLSLFTNWRPYEHRVVAIIEDRLIPIPFNLTGIEILFSSAEAEKLRDLLVNSYGFGQKVPILRMRDSEHAGIRDLADFIYQNVFHGYTTKQWGLAPEQLSPSVTARVPVNISYDDRYFADSFQKMPLEGYTRLFERLTSHSNITLALDTDYEQVASQISFGNAVHTGAVDEFFSYELGHLPYRSLRFDFATLRQSCHQPVGTVNYPTSQAFTRITEMAHLTGQWSEATTVVVEYPQAHQPGLTTPYYPIPQDDNQNLHRRYLQFAAREAPNIQFAGRLGDYRYYNMDQAVGHALAIFTKSIGPSL
ncbi:UDP-galactopyranose mutase [Labrys portucalensis]|uniref:UDP-galactopyranose mutase n=1 Tax=Labrys neptuniae TaxID=376174 RepID=A0ABV6ZRX1_9HYPH